MASEKSKKISSLRELQLLMPRIVPEVNANSRLAIAAAANPLLALEHLGYEFTPQARQEIEPYARFGPDGLKRLSEIEKKWTLLVGPKPLPFDKTTARKIFEQIGNEAPQRQKTSRETSPNLLQAKKLDDALELVFFKKLPLAEDEKKAVNMLSELHAALPLLFEYQKVLVQRPAFATREQFQQLLNGEKKSVATSIEFRLKTSQERRQTRAKNG